MKRLFSVFLIVFLLQTINAQDTLMLRPGPADSKDANIRSDMPGTNYGSSIDFIANAFTVSGQFFIQRSIIEFELSSLPSEVNILNAKLSLYCNTGSGHAQLQYGDNGCVLQRITQEWEEQAVTWINQPQTTSEHEVYLPVSAFQSQDYPDIDITQLMRDHVAFPESSHGIMIKLLTEDIYRTMVFGSADHPDPARRPVLTIIYETCSEPAVLPDFSFQMTGPRTVAFMDNSMGAASWWWDFGDGQTSQEQNPVHEYASAGNYNVCLTVANSCNSLSKCDSVIFCPAYLNPLVLRLEPGNCEDAMIRNDQPDSNYGNSMDYIANAFTAQGNFFIQRSLMNFDFSQLPPNAEILNADLSLFCNYISGHTQLQCGDNLCVLQRITGNWQENTVNWSNQPPSDTVHEVLLSVSENQFQDYPHIDVTQLIRDIYTDPSNIHGIMLKLVNEERYRTLVFASSDNPSVVKRPVLTINYSRPPGSDINADFGFEHNESLTVAFQDHSVGAVDWFWDFGDGHVSNEQNPTHTYSLATDYIVCLTVGNCTETDVFCDTVTFCQIPQAAYSYIQINDSVVDFHNESAEATSWLWDFGDSTWSFEENPEHYYDEPGVYHVCLSAVNQCSISNYCLDIEICRNVYSAFDYLVFNDSIVRFENKSRFASNWQWDFGDGTYSILRDPEHIYFIPGAYNVCLRSINSCSFESVCQRVTLLPPPQQQNMVAPLIVYPNPSHEGFIVMLPDSVSSGYLKVLDMKGDLVREHTIGTGISEVKIPRLDIGIYLVEVKLDGKLYKYKILAQ